MEQISYSVEPIGIIRSPYQDPAGMPIQPAAAEGSLGRVILDPKYAAGLKDLDGFSHLILIYFFHQASGYQLEVKPFLDESKHGVFATRAPKRPNPLGMSVVRLLSLEGNCLEVGNLDILDGTPLLDIKPFVPDFNPPGPVRVGWLEEKRPKIPGKKADGRFS